MNRPASLKHAFFSGWAERYAHGSPYLAIDLTMEYTVRKLELGLPLSDHGHPTSSSLSLPEQQRPSLSLIMLKRDHGYSVYSAHRFRAPIKLKNRRIRTQKVFFNLNPLQQNHPSLDFHSKLRYSTTLNTNEKFRQEAPSFLDFLLIKYLMYQYYVICRRTFGG